MDWESGFEIYRGDVCPEVLLAFLMVCGTKKVKVSNDVVKVRTRIVLRRTKEEDGDERR